MRLLDTLKKTKISTRLMYLICTAFIIFLIWMVVSRYEVKDNKISGFKEDFETDVQLDIKTNQEDFKDIIYFTNNTFIDWGNQDIINGEIIKEIKKLENERKMNTYSEYAPNETKDKVIKIMNLISYYRDRDKNTPLSEVESAEIEYVINELSDIYASYPDYELAMWLSNAYELKALYYDYSYYEYVIKYSLEVFEFEGVSWKEKEQILIGIRFYYEDLCSFYENDVDFSTKIYKLSIAFDFAAKYTILL